MSEIPFELVKDLGISAVALYLIYRLYDKTLTMLQTHTIAITKLTEKVEELCTRI